ncbi:hypothetical protein BT96DRAFT_1015494 [Gymnopus androsaceus JB14]|uniref:SHSP domain-containing protein n=1 Tax=Gymnopus androsaceus JB14 TaxID=1447944 RepID=A0A6A4I7Y9_9AGAR|nr:hypothetical protein BT96DRAFT_1015494 [Gymnopus androsaceus JB14]
MTPTTSGKIDNSDRKRKRTPTTDDDLHELVTRRVAALIKANKLRVVNPTRSRAYVPRCELFEDPASNLVTASFELPGVRKHEIDLHLREGYLVVEGERRRPDNEHVSSSSREAADAIASRREFRVQELRYGKFERRIPVPPGTQDADIKAEVAEGMLKVTWPQSMSQIPRVQVNLRPLPRNDSTS